MLIKNMLMHGLQLVNFNYAGTLKRKKEFFSNYTLVMLYII